MTSLLRLVVLCSAVVLLSHAAEPPHLFQLRLVRDKPSSDSERMELVRQSADGRSFPVVFQVAKGALLDERDIKSAQFQADPLSGRPQVGIIFTDQGRKTFAEVTKTNVNRQLAIIIDGKVISAPVIRTQINDGKAIIDGNFTEPEARQLADRINKAVHPNKVGEAKDWPHGPYDAR